MSNKMVPNIVCIIVLYYFTTCIAERTFVPGCDQTNEGNEFYVGFFRNRFSTANDPEVIPPVLWITTKESTSVNFNVSTIFGLITGGTATPGEITYVNISLGFVVFDSSEDSPTDSRFKGIHIKAESTKMIVVFGQHEEVASNDVYLALPIIPRPAGSSYEYIAASVHGDDGTVQQAKDSVALIIGTENDTEIILEPSVVIGHPFATQTSEMFIPGFPVESRTVTIQRLQTFYLQVRGEDISGTRIIANKPISVFSGHECADVPLSSEPCDMLIEQIAPIDTWGTEVVTIPLITRSADVIKVFASHDSTTVNVTCTNISSGIVTNDSSFTLGRNQFMELVISDYTLIQSNNRIGVFQFSRSYTTDNILNSDPFMLSVPPCEQYRDSYAVAPAPFDSSIAGTVTGRVAYVNYTNIAVPAKYFNASMITVNNNPIDASEFSPIRRSDNSIWGYGAQLILDEGAQIIRHQDPNAALSVTLYGFSNQMSWGCTGGTGLAPVALSVVSFESTGGSGSTIQVNESDGSLEVDLIFSKPVDVNITVFLLATNITATAGEDFGPSQNYPVTFPAGSTRLSVNIPIINDSIHELDENFQLEISVPDVAVAAGVIDGCDPFTPSVTVEITDDDRMLLPPLMPIVRDLITTPYSVNISWLVANITFDTETYSVLYGSDMTMLLSTSEVVEGKSDTSVINEVFSINITGLIPFTAYYYIVRAVNTVGSTNTSVMNFTTDETAPSIAPQNFRDVNRTSTTITFQWTDLAESEANGVVRNYTIICLQESAPFMITVSGTTGIFTGLSPFTEYNCRISAFTVLPGPMSDPAINVTTSQSVPNPPVINTVINISVSTVRVIWSRPTMPNGIISSYTIRYIVNGNNESMNVVYNGLETQSYDISGLSPYQLVTVTVSATNGVGASDLSDEESGRSSEAAPGVIDQFNVNQATVTWRPPLQPNGFITGYQVIYFVYQIPSTKTMSDILDSTITEYYIENLTPGIPYEVVVVAFTSAGKGEENDYLLFFSEELPPSKPPENVAFKQLNLSSLNITYTPLTLFEAQGFPEYRVVLTPLNTSSRRKRQSNPIITTNSSATFTDLKENMLYSIVVGVRTGNSSEFIEGSPINASTIIIPTSGIGIDDDCTCNCTVFIALFIFSIVVIIILVIVVIYLIVKVKKVASYSPKATSNIYDVVELQQKSMPESQAVYENPSVDNEKDMKLEENPAYQTAN